LWNLDLALADVVSTSTDPRLGAVRLAWWRDRLEELDSGAPPAGEPRLSAIHRQLLPITTGATLSNIATAWAPLLEPFPWSEAVADGLRQRGAGLFGVGAEILGAPADGAETAGELWSLADGAFHCSDLQSREFLLEQARAKLGEVPSVIPRELRPLTVLAALAAHDLTRKGSVSRVLAAAHHRLNGKIVRS
jgi:15-cis-phytoene synthase